MIGAVSVAYSNGSGETFWAERLGRARQSLVAQTVYTPSQISFSTHPGERLHDFRNDAAASLLRQHPQLTRIVFLDADDELDPNYVDAMEEHIQRNQVDMNTVIKPSCLNVDDGPNIPEELKDFHTQNWCPIGCVIPVKLFVAMQGFEEWPILEDWAFWLRAEVEFGAKFEVCKEATYIIHNDSPVRRNAPNGSLVSNYWSAQIRRFHGSWKKFMEAQK